MLPPVPRVDRPNRLAGGPTCISPRPRSARGAAGRDRAQPDSDDLHIPPFGRRTGTPLPAARNPAVGPGTCSSRSSRASTPSASAPSGWPLAVTPSSNCLVEHPGCPARRRRRHHRDVLHRATGLRPRQPVRTTPTDELPGQNPSRQLAARSCRGRGGPRPRRSPGWPPCGPRPTPPTPERPRPAASPGSPVRWGSRSRPHQMLNSTPPGEMTPPPHHRRSPAPGTGVQRHHPSWLAPPQRADRSL